MNESEIRERGQKQKHRASIEEMESWAVVVLVSVLFCSTRASSN